MKDEHIFADVCAFGITLLTTTELERWLNGNSQIEACCTYAYLFSLLEIVRHIVAPPLPPPCSAVKAAAAEANERVVIVAQGDAGAGLELDPQEDMGAALLVLW